MALPIFFNADITRESDEHTLDEETSKHVVQVLRMKKDELINVSNGNGYMFLTRITDDHKKKVTVKIIETTLHARPSDISIGISLVKNVQRFEWFLEKAVEIGVAEIFPLICARTERQQFRTSRMQGIMTSAMLQSQQAWLPRLSEPVKFKDFIEKPRQGKTLIAHCVAEGKRIGISELSKSTDTLLLIGPEGDFTPDEIKSALDKNYTPVTLGHTRLRTETAGVVAVTLLNNLNARLPD